MSSSNRSNISCHHLLVIGSGKTQVGLSVPISSHNYAPKWESVPLDQDKSLEPGSSTGGRPSAADLKNEEGEKMDESQRKNPIKMLKIAVPHVLLISVLLSYLAAGAAILQRLENGTEITRRHGRLVELDSLFRRVADETWRLHTQSLHLEHAEWTGRVYEHLQNVSVFFFNRRLSDDQLPLETKWTFSTAILYALTVLTACGYSHIDPVTNEGMIFAVLFALLGIPLMFITAADIGKFLSETFVSFVRLCSSFYTSFMWKFCPKWMKERERLVAEAKLAAQNDLDADNMMSEDDEGDGSMDSLWLPIGGYFFSMCLYCSVGALMFRMHQSWSFIHAFHFAFNTVVTVGLGDVEVHNAFYLALIVAYVIIGLAVVTMCVDLASTHLQRYFRKIHYFGRARRRFLGMSEDFREMMHVITAMRRKKGGAKVTWNDLKEYFANEGFDPDNQQAFVPRNVHLWKFVDETNSGPSTHRPASMTSDRSSCSPHDKSHLSPTQASSAFLLHSQRRKAAEV